MKFRCTLMLILFFVSISACNKTSESDIRVLESIKNSTMATINDSVTIGYAVATAPDFPKTDWEVLKNDKEHPIVIIKSYPYKLEDGKFTEKVDMSSYISMQFEVDQDKKVQITSCGRYKADGTILVARKGEECDVLAYQMYFASHKKTEQ